MHGKGPTVVMAASALVALLMAWLMAYLLQASLYEIAATLKGPTPSNSIMEGSAILTAVFMSAALYAFIRGAAVCGSVVILALAMMIMAFALANLFTQGLYICLSFV